MRNGTPQQPLRIAIERRPHTEAILDGRLPAPRGLAVEFVEVSPINRAFRRMIRDDEFDISEMAVATHYIARAHGARFLALPVFLARHSPHPVMERAASVGSPEELAGARIGSRSYTMTTAIWARGALAEQAGIDLDSVTWVVADEEHVPGTALPRNVDVQPGADLRAMLRAGDLQAGIALAVRDDSVRPLWPDTGAAQREWLERTGADPVNHTLAVSEALLDAHPGLAEELFAWFVESERLASDGAPSSYGLTPGNLASLRTCLELTRRQLPGEEGLPTGIEDCFLPFTG